MECKSHQLKVTKTNETFIEGNQNKEIWDI